MANDAPHAPLSPEHLAQLREARRLLEQPGLAARLSSLVGTPVEAMLKRLPTGLSSKVGDLTQAALMAAFEGALRTLGPGTQPATPGWHKAAAALSGGAGGFFGVAALAVELPLSTTILCRSIADIARAEGEDLSAAEARMACLQVFALGGPTRGDDGAETGYFASRTMMANAVREAAVHLATKRLKADGAPALVRLIALIAGRLQVQITEKAAAQAVPVIGAAAGALINLAFAEHFQAISRGHFTVRRLERMYGEQAVQLAYQGMR